MTKSATREVLRALDEKRERDDLTWARLAAELGVTERTLFNAMAWLRGEGEHKPSRRTTKAIARWLRERGVFIATA